MAERQAPRTPSGRPGEIGAPEGEPGGIFRVIPGIDVYRGRVVRLQQGVFQARTDHGDPVEHAESFVRAGFGLLHVVDLEGAQWGAFRNLELMARIASVAAEGNCRVQFGGGARSYGAIDSALEAGADRVVVSSLFFEEPDAPEQLRVRYGDRVLPAVDVKGGWVAVSGWTQKTDQTPERAVYRLAGAGFREFLMTSVERDGTAEGPDLDLYRRIVRDFPGIDLVASGGVARPEDLESLRRCGVAGVVVGRALYDGSIPLARAARIASRVSESC